MEYGRDTSYTFTRVEVAKLGRVQHATARLAVKLRGFRNERQLQVTGLFPVGYRRILENLGLELEATLPFCDDQLMNGYFLMMVGLQLVYHLSWKAI